MGRAFEYRKARKLKRWGNMARTFTKIGKEIEIAVKSGGPDPTANVRLRILIQNAKPAKEHKERKPSAPREKKPEQITPERDPMLPVMTDHAIGKPIMGRAIADPPMEMKELASDAGLVVVQGDIFKLETKELKGGELLLVTFAITA